ncbi:HTH-type transcriptional regulator DmlR [Roseomonas sp. TAS13]|uniref:LysR family transcriptional regulator n=1 Tax=Roseomonas sp. TAS13 TaxID=1926319 RepID=UPI000960074F|nr:LysR family transcriptional regulator [Roseomonas sp. TAS13]USQ73922.1 LysR family transcriptional regulator [Roseomonas mucosa]GAV33926.1 HTH-type transcriptional regulator DmlR [Roseomonas sp. TAS13]
MDRIELFRIFVQVVDCGSFSRAADVVGISRSSVSIAIQELEARVGARLLHRTTRKVTTTQEGIAFHERCRRVLEEVEEAETLFRPSGDPHGKLRVDLPGRIGRLIVAPRLPEFLDHYPNIDVMLGVSDRAINLLEEAADCVLRVGPLADSGMIARSLGELPLINVASPSYLARHGIPREPADLDRHHMVLYASPSTDRVETFEWIEHQQACFRTVTGRVTVNSAEAYIACCLAGLGLIQIPAYDVRDQIATGALVEVLPHHRAAPMPMTLLFPHRRHLPRRTQVFADWLASIIAEATAPWPDAQGAAS